MYYIRSICIFIFILIFLALSGCKQDGDTPSPSTPDMPPLHEKTENRTKEVTIGGKVWKIDPDFSYQATGIWNNPNPRPLTNTETSRLQEIPDEIKELRMQLNDLNREQRYLQRIDKPQIKMRFSFGKPPHFSPEGIKNIIDLGEFPMEMETPQK